MWKEREICEIIRIICFCEIGCLILIWKGCKCSIDIEYSADINNNFTASDEYNGFGYVAQITDEALPLDTEFVVPAGICSVKYDMPESGGGAVTVKTGNILKYSVDTSDSTKFTLSLYDKNKNLFVKSLTLKKVGDIIDSNM